MRRKRAPTSPAKTRPRAVPIRSGRLGREVADPPRGAQDALLVLARGLGRAGDEDHLAAVGVDVGLEERDAVLVGDPLRARDRARRARAATSLGAGLREQGVDAAEVHEGDRGLPVLGLGAAVRDLRGGTAAGHARARDRAPSSGGSGSSPPAAPGRRLQQAATFLLRRRRAGSGSVAAVSSLTRISPASAPDSISTVRVTPGPGQQQLPVRLADEEEVEGVGVDADVHLQRHRPDRGLRLSELTASAVRIP